MAGKEDLRQRLEDRNQAHAWIQTKLQSTFLYWRIVVLKSGKEDLWQRLEDEIRHMPEFRPSLR